MTVLTNELLTASLQSTHGWKKAEESMQLKEASPPYTD
jgi:hypothetical protein